MLIPRSQAARLQGPLSAVTCQRPTHGCGVGALTPELTYHWQERRRKNHSTGACSGDNAAKCRYKAPADVVTRTHECIACAWRYAFAYTCSIHMHACMYVYSAHIRPRALLDSDLRTAHLLCQCTLAASSSQVKRRNALRRAADTALALAWANLEQFGSTT